jgi:hypothetical protein
VLVPWTPLTPSRRERAVRRIGVALGLATSSALLVAASRSEPLDPFLGVAALLALLGSVLAGRAAPTGSPIEVAIDQSGVLAVRRVVDTGSEPGVQCVFHAPWLITLKRGTMLIPIWPDAVPGNTYRRLWVHVRWGAGQQPANLPARIAPGKPE